MYDVENPVPKSILYTMIRVRDLEVAVEFYTLGLGMKELRREEFTEGRFTLVFVGYDENQSILELTYNWDETHYHHGTGYGHIALGVKDLFATCLRLKQIGVRVIREPGPMIHAVDSTGAREVIAFIEDPDGYKIELIQF